MSDEKKRRMSMLDSLAAAGAAAPPASMLSSNRALRSARTAVDGHHVWELDPNAIDDSRLADRLDPHDVADLRDAIEANGQAVPILVRRHPTEPERYLLVYGRRRLEAIRQSDKIDKVRALVATLDDDAALRSQISENMARRDLTFIEKALFAQELVATGFGNQSQVAEVLTVSKSAISMALAVVETVGRELAEAIGPAQGIGRPRWEALARAISDRGASLDRLVAIAEEVRTRAAVAAVIDDGTGPAPGDASVQAFEAVAQALAAPPAPPPRRALPPAERPVRTTLRAAGQPVGALRRSARGLSIEIEDGVFADWVEAQAQDLIDELHARWLQRGED